MRKTINFLVVLLEWYEFTVYNALIPYGVFGGSGNVLQYGFALGALSFLARPIGAIYFSSLTNKEGSLKRGLLLMSISTILMGTYPGLIPKPIWFGICKILQGFSLGGSYGLSALSVYEKEQVKDKPKTNYKLGILQTGWVYGMLLGQFTVLIFKMLFGNQDTVLRLLKAGDYIGLSGLRPSVEFVAYGWRFIFLLSGFCGLLLYFKASKVKVQSTKSNILVDIHNYLRKNPLKFLSIFMVLSIDMVLFHSWFTYDEALVETSHKALTSNIVNNIRRLLLLINFPVMGYLTDRLNQIFNEKGNKIMLVLTCCLMITFSIVKLDQIPWILVSAITASMCYGSLFGWAIRAFGKDASSLLGPTCNFTAALLGGTIPLVSSLIPHSDYLTISLTCLSLIGLLLIR